jgi:cell wall-associated NlpC family hydrolase
LVLTGDVEQAQCKESLVADFVGAFGGAVKDEVRLLPDSALGEKVVGIGCLSVTCGREEPSHKAEMGTQIVMGQRVQVLKKVRDSWLVWYWVRSADGYLSWLEEGTFHLCSESEAERWRSGAHCMVTVSEAIISTTQDVESEPVGDVVMGNVLKGTLEGGWWRVELPDGRKGWLPKKAAIDLEAWRASRNPTAENIERTARSLLGRPYIWGGNSPKGLDCSGFTKTVFGWNGIELLRNASHQARQGVAVPTDLAQLRKGDLLFFGLKAHDGRPERIVHVGIYLGNSLFIHSAESVHISSLDPASPICDVRRMQTLIRARRILPE